MRGQLLSILFANCAKRRRLAKLISCPFFDCKIVGFDHIAMILVGESFCSLFCSAQFSEVIDKASLKSEYISLDTTTSGGRKHVAATNPAYLKKLPAGSIGPFPARRICGSSARVDPISIKDR